MEKIILNHMYAQAKSEATIHDSQIVIAQTIACQRLMKQIFDTLFGVASVSLKQPNIEIEIGYGVDSLTILNQLAKMLELGEIWLAEEE